MHEVFYFEWNHGFLANNKRETRMKKKCAIEIFITDFIWFVSFGVSDFILLFHTYEFYVSFV